MASKRLPIKKIRGSGEKTVELPEVALAAITSYKKQNEVCEFITYLLEALDRNSGWLNNLVIKQDTFKCALMVGAGPNRFQIQDIIYPSNEDDIKLEVEMRDSEDHDKIAIAALVRLSISDLDYLLKYLKTRMFENSMLRDDLLKGKALGISFAVLRPFDRQYRVMERISFGNTIKCAVPIKKRRTDDKLFAGPPIKKSKRVV